MRIRNASLNVVDLPLRVPFRTALRATSLVTDIRVVLETDEGLFGYGSASPTPAITGETTESIVSAIENYIFPSIRDVDLADEESAWSRIRSALVHNRSAKAAVDIAFYDLYAKQQGESLSAYLGNRRPPTSVNSAVMTGSAPEAGSSKQLISTLPKNSTPLTISTDSTVSLGTVDAMAKQAVNLTGSGFSVLKVKLGGRDGLDVERIRCVREAVGFDVTIRVDANQAWGVQEAIKYAQALMAYDIELIEQPVPAHDVKGLAEITRNSPVPIAADESVYDREDLTRVIDQQAAHIVNIKLMKSGGLYEAQHMIEQARSAGLDFMIGSMMEGQASVTAAAHLAAAYSCRYIDLDAAYFLSESKAWGGITYNASTITLPTAPGLGAELATVAAR